MGPNNGWNSIGGREHFNINPYEPDKNSRRKLDSRQTAFVIFALAIIGIAVCLKYHHEILDVLKAIATGIWNMLRSMADACGDLWEYVKHQRST